MTDGFENNQRLIHAYITNTNLPDTMDELTYGSNIETLLEDSKEHCTEWSAPRDGHEGDILLFLFSKNARNNLRAIKKENENLRPNATQLSVNKPVRPRRGRNGNYIFRKNFRLN